MAIRKTGRFIGLGALVLLAGLAPALAGVLMLGDDIPQGLSRLASVDGRQVSVSSYLGDAGAMIVFTDNSCPAATAWAEKIVDLGNRIRSKSVSTVLINSRDPETSPDDSFDKMKERATALGMNFPYVVDEGGLVAEAFGATHSPEVFLFSGMGKLVYHGSVADDDRPGAATQVFLEEALETMLDGDEIVTPETTNRGCELGASPTPSNPSASHRPNRSCLGSSGSRVWGDTGTMVPEPSELQARIDDLERRLAEVERRMARFGTTPAPPEPLPGSDAADEPLEAVREVVGSMSLPLVGRTLLVMAGAFLLRAITGAGVVAEGVGVTLGIAYALIWIVLADRAVAAGRRASATLHGLAAALIAFPLLWEATTRFGFLSPAAGAAALGIVTLLAFVVAWHRKLRRLAWVFTVGAAATAVAMAVATKALVLYASFLLLLGIGALWLGYLRGWRGPAWLAAAVVNGMVLLMTVTALVARGEQALDVLLPSSLVAVQLSLIVAYIGSFAVRALLRSEKLQAGEIVQTGAVMLIGLGGALAVSRSAGLSGTGVGIVCLVAATGCYLAAFAFIDPRLGQKINFMIFSSSALVFGVAAPVQRLHGAALALVFAAAALFTSWLGARRQRATLGLHGAVYALAATAAVGLVAGAARVLVGSDPPRDWLTWPMLVVLAAVGICFWFPPVTHGRTWGRVLSRAPRVTLLVVLVLGLAGIVVHLVLTARPVTGAAQLAVLRTGVLALGAVGLALLDRWRGLREASWVMYAALVAGGLKLALEDLPAGTPLTLFASLALYGGALIVAPRLTRSTGNAA